jgi:hypothetical protein
MQAAFILAGFRAIWKHCIRQRVVEVPTVEVVVVVGVYVVVSAT